MKFRNLIPPFFLFLLVGGGLYYFLNLPVNPDSPPQQFTVNQGDSVVSISSRLETNHLIRSRYYFIIVARLMGLHQQLQAGNFQVSSALTTRQLITKLSLGGVTDYWFRIVEGSRLEEFA